MSFPKTLSAPSLVGLVLGSICCATPAKGELPLVFKDTFDSPPASHEGPLAPSAEHFAPWAPKDPSHWKFAVNGEHKVLSHFVKKGKYKPPHRSPVNIAVRQTDAVSDFQLTARVLSTHPDYGHRDACLVFGYQDPAHFYYVHFGKKTDDHANQIFIVDGAARTKISTSTTEGTPWDDQWHTIRVSRAVKSGKIEVFYDDMQNPVMTATNQRFQWGHVGMGSFDDTTDWDWIELRGARRQK